MARTRSGAPGALLAEPAERVLAALTSRARDLLADGMAAIEVNVAAHLALGYPT